MADLTGINKTVRELVRTLLNMPANSVRPANQNAPAGAKTEQFATVLITIIDRTGWDESNLKNEISPSTNVAETIIGQRKFTASVQFFRGDAYTKAARLGILLQTSSAIGKMQAVGLGLVKVGAATNLTAVVDTFWEERGQIIIEFHLVQVETVSTPTFGRFPIITHTETSTITSEVFEP